MDILMTNINGGGWPEEFNDPLSKILINSIKPGHCKFITLCVSYIVYICSEISKNKINISSS